ncbi:hypothetical protein PRZ48_013039 [Zasmidium cellare]|uniref:Major facilitator superfamily (MFS) profile domain-containing protein n=1 Tax=Zasmidium cellare TaxID=395010 RepID=A0ABR0E3G0_ZASCE|nr:hypothetical protein PRZ48_013039 [Zasmidium cellare]
MASSSGTPVAGPSIRTSTGSITRSSSHHQPSQDHKHPTVNIETSSEPSHHDAPPRKPFKRSWRFWAIILSLSIMALCGTVEATIIINALPTVVSDLGGGSAYLWIPNAFLLASVAVLPLYSQLSDIFGRRYLLLGAVSLFILGSGLCGAAKSMGWLIAARAIAGLGSGGIEMLVETVVTDLVPLRERSKYESLVLTGSLVGCTIGPFLGGVIVVKLGWRWIFYLNVILGGASLLMLFVFLKVKHRRNQTLVSRLKRIDIGGNAIFIGSVVAVLLALTWGGPVYQWDSFRIILPLVLGLLGLLVFTTFEWTPKLAPEPSFPRALLSNRTSAAALMQSFILSVLTFWSFYFLPVYFQGVLRKSPLGSGVAIVPISACVVPFCIVGGVALSKFGRYKPIHFISWAILITGLGLCSLLDRNSSTAAWACFEIVCSAGIGLVTPTLLPAVQAPLEEKHVATSTGLWSFTRGFGSIWGVTIPSVIFTNEVRRYTGLVQDAGIAERLANGQAYELATKSFLDSITDEAVRDQVIEVFTLAIKTVWYVGIAVAGSGLLVVFIQKEVKLRQEMPETEFGMDDGRPTSRTAATDEIPLEDMPARRSE